jgi:hypothetical protein
MLNSTGLSIALLVQTKEERRGMTDPNPNDMLKRLRRIVQENTDPHPMSAPHEELDEVLEVFNALDEWLSGGNTLPDYWAFAVPPLVFRMEAWED